MEAPVGRVGVLVGAVGAHGERGHRGVRPVVGETVDDREARAARGAVDKGVVVPAVLGVKKLGQAGVAGCDVGGDERRAVGRGVTLHDSKVARAHHAADPQLAGVPGSLEVLVSHAVHMHRVDPCGGRLLGREGEHERVERLLGALGLDVHAVRGVAHPAREPEGRGRAPHEGPVAHALDDPRDMDVDAGHPNPPAGSRWLRP